ncbi:MAG: vWA domain-containing protein [Desulfomonilaceae bacterium]
MRTNKKRNEDLIETFYIPGQDGYSEYWRRDKSPVESMELAKLLRSIRKISSYVARNTGDIVWAGMECQNGISLDPSFLMGTYPVPAGRTDIVVGIAIRKAYLKTEWSERFKKIALDRLDLMPVYAYKFGLFFDMAERIYVDCLSNHSILGLYTEKAREWELVQKYAEFINPPTATEMLHIWWKMAANRSGHGYKEEYRDRSAGGLTERTSVEKFYKKPIALLNSIIEPLINVCPRIDGVTERGDFRIALYTSIWPELLQYFKFWPGDRADHILLADQFREELEKEEEGKKALKATLLSLTEDIERNLRPKAVDFTSLVKSIVRNVDEVVRIEGNDIVMPARDRIDRKLQYNLKLVIQAIAQRNTTYNRGLVSGKINRRRLHRAPTSGAVFQLKKNCFELINDIVLLVDCTGSMAGPTKWDWTETMYQTIFAAIKAYNKNAQVFAYNEVKGACRITELYLGGKFYTVLPHGKTASGEAIIATALTLKRKLKRPFIIHITDGASNWGCGVKDAIEFCKKNRIKLLTLGLGCDPSNKNALKKEYGKLVQFVDDMNDLPEYFRALLTHSKWN